MTFMRSRSCNLRVLEGSDEEFHAWTEGVMRRETLKYTLTGSVPTKFMDIRKEWEREIAAGAVIFGIWVTPTRCRKCAPPSFPHRCEILVGTTGLYTPYPTYNSFAFRVIIWDEEAVGKGIGTEATWMVTDYAFRTSNCHRLWLGVHEDNVGAWKVYERVGFKKEGVFRDAIYCYGKYSDTWQYAMLRPEWEKLCKKRGMPTSGMFKDFSGVTM